MVHDTNPPSYPDLYFINYIPTTNSYMITSPADIGHQFPTRPGSLYSLDDGMTWHFIDNLAHGWAAFASPIVGWSAGPNNIVYKWDSSVLTSINEKNNIIESFGLEQNYPNPFNPSTTIKFQVPNTSFVNLKVYDILGNEVATLVNEEKPVGTYELNWNAINLPSGVYFYRCKLEILFKQRKMILLK